MGRTKLSRNNYLNNPCACLKCNTVISQIDELTLCKCKSTYIRTVCWSLKQYCSTCFDSTISSTGKPCAKLTKSVLGGGETIHETIKVEAKSTVYLGQHLIPSPLDEEEITSTIIVISQKDDEASTTVAAVGEHLTLASVDERESTDASQVSIMQAEFPTLSNIGEKLITKERVIIIIDESIALPGKEEEVTTTAAASEHFIPSSLDEGGANDALEVLPEIEEEVPTIADDGDKIALTSLDEREILDKSKVLHVKQEMIESSADDRKQPASASLSEGLSIVGMRNSESRDFVKCSSMEGLRLKLQKGRICYTFCSTYKWYLSFYIFRLLLLAG